MRLGFIEPLPHNAAGLPELLEFALLRCRGPGDGFVDAVESVNLPGYRSNTHLRNIDIVAPHSVHNRVGDYHLQFKRLIFSSVIGMYRNFIRGDAPGQIRTIIQAGLEHFHYIELRTRYKTGPNQPTRILLIICPDFVPHADRRCNTRMPGCVLTAAQRSSTQRSRQNGRNSVVTFLAVLLSLLFVGWGQWYDGKTWNGLKFLGAFWRFYVMLLLFSYMASIRPL